MSENDVNLAALWVPVMASTSELKGQLVKAGTEAGAAGGAAMKTALSSSLKGISGELGAIFGAMGTGGAVREVDVLTSRWGRLKDTITGASDGAGKAMQAFNVAGTAAVVGLGAAFVETTKKAGDFQASQERLVASAGETKAGMDQVSNGILQLAGQVGYSADQLSTAMYSIEKAGYRGAQGVNVLTAAAQGAKSENAELAPVIDALSASMSNFGINADASADVMSKLVAGSGMAKATFQDYAGSLHSVEVVAGTVGQSLDQLGKQHLLSDIYGSLAQLTQSNMSATQATQNMGRAFGTLSNPTAKMRDELGQLGLNAEDIQQHLGERGLAGTAQILDRAIREHMTPAGQVMIDTFRKSEQATGAAKTMFDALPPAAQKVAEAVKNNSEAYKAYRKDRGGLSVEQANEVDQWLGIEKQITGFSTALKSGQGDVQTYLQAMGLLTGNQETARVALLLSGQATDEVNGKIHTIDQTTREHDGTVKGFNETQSTLNAKMADAKAAFGAAAIEIGTAFIPVMTDVANIAKTVGDAMARHPAILHGVVTAVEALSTAWVGVKAINIVSGILAPATVAAGELAVAEDAAAVSAGGLKTALLGLAGPVAAGLTIGPAVGKKIEDVANSSNWLNDHVRNPVRNFFGADSIPDKHAAGGQITGSGPKGKDSVPAWLAPGEHVLTAAEVDSMGGQAGVYAFRKGLHRQGGGGIPGYDQGGAAPSVPIVQRPDGTWTSPNPAWAHLMQRESSGSPTIQNNTDSNAQHGDPSQGLFQFTTATWQRMGGGQFAAHPGQATPQQQAIMAARLIQANPSGSDWGAGISGRESAGELRSGLGTAGNPMYTAPTAEHAARADARVKEIQERLGELKPDAKQSTKDRLNDELGFAKQDQARAHDKEAAGGGSGGSGQGKTQSQAEQFGSGLLSGAMSDLGFGNVLGGKSPLDWPLVKMFTGLASAGLSAGNAWASSKMAGGDGGIGAPGGIPGLNSSGGSGGGESPSGLGGISAGMGDGQGPSDTGLGAGPGGGGNDALSNLATSPLLSISKFAGASGSNGLGGIKAGPGSAGMPGLPQGVAAGVPSWQGMVSGGPNAPKPGSPDWYQQYQQQIATKGGDPAGFMPPIVAARSGVGALPPSGPLMPKYTEGPQVVRVPTQHFATGGPVGSDTVPAWLSPGEFVVNSGAAKQYAPQLKSMNAQHFASGGNVSLTPSSVSSVPMASSHSGGTSYSGGHHIVNDNRIIVQGNHMTDADQLAGPMQERQNAAVYQRSQFGGLPMAVGPGGG